MCCSSPATPPLPAMQPQRCAPAFLSHWRKISLLFSVLHHQHKHKQLELFFQNKFLCMLLLFSSAQSAAPPDQSMPPQVPTCSQPSLSHQQQASAVQVHMAEEEEEEEEEGEEESVFCTRRKGKVIDFTTKFKTPLANNKHVCVF
jgi:hypothetical protein